METLLFKVEDLDRPLSGGGIALVCEEGRIGTDEVSCTSQRVEVASKDQSCEFAGIQHFHDAFQIGAVAVGDLRVGA